jgi:hypothetical protein
MTVPQTTMKDSTDRTQGSGAMLGAASLLALVAAATVHCVLPVCLSLAQRDDGGSGSPDSPVAVLELIAACLGCAAAVVGVGTWLLYRHHRLRLRTDALRFRSWAPVTGRWIPWFACGLILAAALSVGADAATYISFYWAFLMIPVAIVAALANGGDVD